MTDSLQQKTISYGSKGNIGRYGLDTPPPAAHISYDQRLVGRRFGWVTIISPEKRWAENWRDPMVLTQCTSCHRIQWTSYSNLKLGKSRGCQRCSQPRQIPRWLDRRLTAAKQRCTNPNDANYRNYGARGIEFRFNSVREAGLWITTNLGIPERNMELDRIDNDGHYEVGNLRFVSRQSNVGNRRVTVLPDWDPEAWPYARSVVTRKLASGMSREEIMAEARDAVANKRKNWRGIKARLESMTY